MKKNLRIVSAAAAALLAVAPIATVAVSNNAAVVQAAAPNSETNPVKVAGVITLNRNENTQFSLNLNDSQKAAVLQNLGLDVNPSSMNNIQVYSVTAADNNGKFTQKFTFQVNGTTYYGEATAQFASQQGTPYFYNKNNNTVINNGDTVTLDDFANGFTATDLLNKINSNYGWKTSDASSSNAEMTTTASDIESQLVKQGLKRASNGSFDYPANGFNLTLSAKSQNGSTATITVRVNASINYNAPAFVVTPAGQRNVVVYYNNNIVATSGVANNNIILNANTSKGVYSEAVVKDQITAYVQSAYNVGSASHHATTESELSSHSTKLNGSNVKWDFSAVNSSVAGIYPVVITATNPAGYVSKLTVKVIVNGSEHEAPTKYANADGVKVYNINGNVVSDTNTTLKKGDAVKTYGEVPVDGTKYTRINSATSNTFVKSSDLTSTKPEAPKPAETTVTKRIMHNAYYYDKNHVRIGNGRVTRYNNVTVVDKTVSIDGRPFYKLADKVNGQEAYIDADNIDGTPRTLKHNAYVYKTSKKRANKKVLKKGETITTYGRYYTFKNGKHYYKIGDNTEKTYVKVANFD
ncbi:SLAP domain-containing protein [Lactobacillus intestinalis]|uniref:SLAP domain-containing protein n=1 Tax=Lactobacillus intestinalis TaxID=151781 RepID=UPI0025A9873E|nr:SLAP domain-containing protein [Lactobacillus intestinalis]